MCVTYHFGLSTICDAVRWGIIRGRSTGTRVHAIVAAVSAWRTITRRRGPWSEWLDLFVSLLLHSVAHHGKAREALVASDGADTAAGVNQDVAREGGASTTVKVGDKYRVSTTYRDGTQLVSRHVAEQTQNTVECFPSL